MYKRISEFTIRSVMGITQKPQNLQASLRRQYVKNTMKKKKKKKQLTAVVDLLVQIRFQFRAGPYQGEVL